jgi:farnesyl-diphosphate farnesyltransferase
VAYHFLRDVLIMLPRLAQIEQWAEHHYPSFVVISASNSGQVSSAIDAEGGDARAKLYASIVEKEKVKAQKRRQEEILDTLRSKGLIKPKFDAEGNEVALGKVEKEILEAQQPMEGFPILLVGAIALMILIVFGVTATVIVVGVKYFAVPSLHVPEEL